MVENTPITESKKQEAFELLDQNRIDDAVTVLEEIIQQDKQDPEVWNVLGAAYGVKKDSTRAEKCLLNAVELKPDSPEAHYNLANVYREQNKPDFAIKHYYKVLNNAPDHIGALVNLGGLLFNAGNLEEARKLLEQANDIESNIPAVHYNLGKVYCQIGEYQQAVDSYHKTMNIQQNYLDTYNNLARVLLTLGQFEEGWYCYIFRQSQRRTDAILPPDPQTLPEDLGNKRILILTDQGLGDELFFLTFAPKLKARGAWIAYRPNPKLTSIVSRLTFLDEVIVEDENPENIDYTLSVGDLPLITGMRNVTHIPPAIEINPLDDHIDSIKERLAMAGQPPYIGVTWRGGMQDKGGLYKSVPLRDLAESLKDIHGTILVLQRNPEAGEIEAFQEILGRPVHDFSDMNENLEDMLALVSTIQAYVTVSNANVHLRTAANRTSHVLVPHPPEWRWMASGQESPWFPGTTLYRENYPDGWAEALKDLRANLLEEFGES